MFNEKKIEVANRDKVKALDVQVDEILFELGQEGALVTDNSELCDFLGGIFEADEMDRTIEDLSYRLGVEIMDEYELVVNVAQKMKDKLYGSD